VRQWAGPLTRISGITGANTQTPQPPTQAFRMSAKNVGGSNGKKPASAATNLIGMPILLTFSLFPTQEHMLTKHHSWRSSRYDGSTCMPPTWYLNSLQNVFPNLVLTMAPRYHQSTNAALQASTSTRSKEARLHQNRSGNRQERNTPGFV